MSQVSLAGSTKKTAPSRTRARAISGNIASLQIVTPAAPIAVGSGALDAPGVNSRTRREAPAQRREPGQRKALAERHEPLLVVAGADLALRREQEDRVEVGAAAVAVHDARAAGHELAPAGASTCAIAWR